MKTFTTAAALVLALASSAFAVSPIEMQGANFVDTATGNRFFIIGVDYQPGGSSGYGTSNSDPLSNATTCLRDAVLMQELGVNTIRSYNVDPTLNHDECVSIFNEAGIYMVIDVNSPLAGQSIDRSNPSGTYTTGYLNHIFSVVEAFKSYPNTLGFFAGNEVINDIPTAGPNPPYIRAVQRDLKNYIAAHATRTIPVGYSAADVREVLEDTWAYLQCEIANQTTNGNDTSRSDFFGLNSYSWCGSSATYTSSGYNDLVTIFSNTTIPVFFSEYGCNEPAPRVFNEVQALYGPQMTVMSGGLVYEWSNEANSYGLVNLSSSGSAQLIVDYTNLQSQYDKLNITLLQSTNTTAQSAQPPQCAPSLISSDGFSTDFDIPSPPSGASALIASGIQSAPTGKIVSVSQTSVQVPVYATNGATLSNLVLKASNGSNTPNSADVQSVSGSATSSATGSATGKTTASATGSGGSASASATGKSEAVRVGLAGGVVAGVVAAAALL